MRIGQTVMYIGGCEPPMPPTGAIGEIVSALDEDGEHDVLFPEFPCPNGPEPDWIVPATNLIPLLNAPDEIETSAVSESANAK